ncbi:MAG: hypothetical protein RLZ98_2820 [Pseudomonadota bacterium]
MKAMVVRKYGGQDAIDLEEIDTPRPKKGEVLVQVRAVTVNRTRDLNVIKGSVVGPEYLPLIPGQDPAGQIVELGKGVADRKVGERVIISSKISCGKCPACKAGHDSDCRKSQSIGIHRPGGYAEFVAVPASQCFPISKKLTFGEAAVIMRHVPMAMQQLDRKAGVRKGDWVLVMGASGGLGSACVQVAKYLGAKVIVGAGGDDRVRQAMALGGDYGINYRKQNLSKKVREITEGHGVDVVCENISDPSTWPEAFKSMAPLGRMVTSGAHGGGKVEVDMKYLYHHRLQIIGAAGSDKQNVADAFVAAGKGRIKAVVDLELPLAELTRAFDLIDQRKVAGKVVIDPAL